MEASKLRVNSEIKGTVYVWGWIITHFHYFQVIKEFLQAQNILI